MIGGDNRKASFDVSGAKRIIASTRYVESLSRESTSQDRGTAYNRPQFRIAKVTAKTAINGAIRFKYTLRIGHWDMTISTATGGTWVDDSSATDSYGWSTAEDMNTFTSGTGAIGTGNTNVTQSDGTINGGSCKLLPIPIGSYVVVVLRGIDSSGKVHWNIVNFANSAQ